MSSVLCNTAPMFSTVTVQFLDLEFPYGSALKIRTSTVLLLSLN